MAGAERVARTGHPDRRPRVVLTAVVVLAVASAGASPPARAADAAIVPADAPLAPVEWRWTARAVEMPGVLRPEGTATVSSPAKGVLADVKVATGDRVRAGDVVAHVRPADAAPAGGAGEGVAVAAAQDGWVAGVARRAGEPIAEGEEILTIAPAGARYLLEIEKEPMPHLGVTDGVSVRVQSFAEPLPAHVVESPDSARPGPQRFVAALRENPDLRPGLSAAVLLTVRDRRVLAVPASAIRSEAGETKAVRVDRDGRAGTVSVRTGETLMNDYVEIVSGLAIGDRVVLPPEPAPATKR